MSTNIIVRNRHFNTKAQDLRQTVNEQPIAIALYTSLSATFPLGEAFFVRSVAQFAKDIPATLKIDVDAFVRQEALHSREHAKFNDVVATAGLPIENATRYACKQLNELEKCPPIKRLAVTIGLEHFTAVFAHVVLSDPRHLSYCDPESLALWQWHAVEEIEHKAVAMDVFNHVTAAWSPVRRWIFRCGVMIETMARLAFVVWNGIADVMAVEGHKKAGWQLTVLSYLFAKPGLISAMGLQVARYFVPGFHPNDSDESQLLAQARFNLGAVAQQPAS
jgi:uncharacterized protein